MSLLWLDPKEVDASDWLTRQPERAKVRKATESTLLATVMKIVTYVNTHKDHIPPITTTESNPFPYQIHINQKEAGWATRMGIY